MSLLDSYLNIKNKVKLNDAIMDGVAKAISQKAASDFQEIINSSSLNSASPIDHEEKENLDYIPNSAEPLKLGTKRDFDTVMSTIKSLKKLENDDSFIQTKSLVESFFTKNLDEDSVKELMGKLKVSSDLDAFKSILFWGLYFTVYSVFEESASKDDVVVYGSEAVDLLVKVNYPSFGDWIQQAKAKYRDSDIFTNPYSENWLKFFYNNIEFDREISEETIISNLLELQQRLVNEFSDSKHNKLTARCYKHPKAIAKNEAEKKKKEVEKKKKEVEKREKEDSASEAAILIVVLIIIALLFCLIVTVFNK